jgi:putative cardiolipin synthase
MPALRSLLALLAVFFLAGCAATLPDDLQKNEPAYAPAPQPGGPLAAVEEEIARQFGPEMSGFRLLDSNEDGLRWRLALIDSAQHSLDLQYYVWWGDEAGILLMKRVVDAANRGVQVRIIVDDLTTTLLNSAQPQLRDSGAAIVGAHPNIEVRLFNPWRRRSFAGRIIESIGDLDRVNQRMHNKLMIADNRATIIGGRNVGNEYFGLSPEFNFRDLDTLGIGPVGRQASEVFDRFWNSDQVVAIEHLDHEATSGDTAAAFSVIGRRLADSPKLTRFVVERRDWSDELTRFEEEMHQGSSRVLADTPGKQGEEEVNHVMPLVILQLMEEAQHDVLITNAYIIPSEETINWLEEQIARGVRFRVLTNSLASHDVPAVNAHYKRWRDDLVGAGVELYEMRPDAAIQSLVVDTAPVEGEFMGLHSKAMVIDSRRVLIGSMNLDPRSWRINSEMGVLIESPGLAERLTEVMERDMQLDNAWQVALDNDGSVVWTGPDEVLHSQPARNFWQRVEDVVFMAVPKEIY